MATGVALSLIQNPTNEAVPLTEPGIIISLLLWVGMMALFVWLLVARRTPGRLVAWRTMWACGFLLLTLIILLVFNQGGVHGVARAVGERRAESGEPVSTFNVQRSTFNVQLSTFNVQRSTFNAQRSFPCIQIKVALRDRAHQFCAGTR
jgi:glucan phosphoethanolaminetransferase (alkaline phosphatase superfamily)